MARPSTIDWPSLHVGAARKQARGANHDMRSEVTIPSPGGAGERTERRERESSLSDSDQWRRSPRMRDTSSSSTRSGDSIQAESVSVSCLGVISDLGLALNFPSISYVEASLEQRLVMADAVGVLLRRWRKELSLSFTLSLTFCWSWGVVRPVGGRPLLLRACPSS